jgi:hypothetical protein
VRDQHHGQLELSVAAQVDEDVGDEHRYRAVREVDHAGTAVLEHQPLAEDGVGGAGAQAEDQEEQVAGHDVSFTSGYNIEAEIGGIGVLRNHVVPWSAAHDTPPYSTDLYSSAG